MVAHTFNPSTQEVEEGGYLCPKPPLSTDRVPEQPVIHRETLSQKPKQNKTKKKFQSIFISNYSVFDGRHKSIIMIITTHVIWALH